MIWIVGVIFLVILIFVAIVCSVQQGDIGSVKVKKNLIGCSIASFFGGILFFVIYLVCSGHGFKDGYKQGQVNAILGKAEYKLVIKPDSSWHKTTKKYHPLSLKNLSFK